jgi:hypothetical protein
MIRPERKAFTPERLKDLNGEALDLLLRNEMNNERPTVEKEILAQLVLRDRATKLLIDRLPKA